jgi:hypothetical protein
MKHELLKVPSLSREIRACILVRRLCLSKSKPIKICYLGDIRRYEAVDNPRLHKLKNVVVFPMDGPRSMTTELTDGHLDGDIFWISWDSRLIFRETMKPFVTVTRHMKQRHRRQLHAKLRIRSMMYAISLFSTSKRIIWEFLLLGIWL